MNSIDTTPEGTILAWKLFKRRQDGSLGPLFINARQRIELGEWLPALDVPTKGFAPRWGWHATLVPEAPHLSMKPKGGPERVWCRVELRGPVSAVERPEAQGGTWLLCHGEMRVVSVEEGVTHE